MTTSLASPIAQPPLEPVTATFPASLDGPSRTPEQRRSPIRELGRRTRDGIDVRLLWNQSDDRVLVAVVDAKTADAVEIEVEAGESLAAFHHPYAYAAFRRMAHTERLVP